jgi:Ca2+-binding EF-hand superfamily protein
MNRATHLAAAMVSIAFAAAAAAAEQKVSFDSLDKNSDGKVSVNEATVNDALFVEFKNLDTNKDGELTKEEFARHQGGK